MEVTPIYIIQSLALCGHLHRHCHLQHSYVGGAISVKSGKPFDLNADSRATSATHEAWSNAG